ncbi:Cyclic AMP-dependent transcription factor ATF-6 beta [Aphelenchoides bicaudatus]|nr:Cyclic AMP-dependent transcription factor ATF-6 beta [Aphelenchoides bicaudatus]
MYSNALDEADIKFYDEFLSSHLDDEAEITRWSNEFNPDLELDPNLDLIHDDLGAIVDDGSDLKYSPQSSDSGNHSPSTISSDCGFNSDPWTSGQYEHGMYSEDFVKPPMQSSHNTKPTFINNNNYVAPKLTPVSVSVNHINNASATFTTNTPTYFANALPSSSTSNIVVARPLEAIRLVPATVASNGQFIISSAPTLKLAPIQKPTQLQQQTITPVKQQNGESMEMDDDEYRKKMEDRRLRNRAAAQASRNKKRQQMDTMKDQLTECETECDRLRVENEGLKRRVAELEKENEMLLSTQNGNGILKHKKAKAVTGVCLAMCALVFTFSGSLPARDLPYPTTDLQISNALSMEDSPEYLYLRRHGRSLAEVQDYDAMPDPPEQIASNKTIRICPPSFLNASEKIRLNNDINNWIDRHAQMDFVELRQGMSPFLIHKSDRRQNAPKQLSNSTGVLKLSAEDRRKIRLEKRDSKNTLEKEKSFNKRTVLGRTIKLDELNNTLKKDNTYELAVRSESDARLMEELAAAIKKREDTLYVVTMKDYFLMPMLHRNATNSPRLSILIPALHTGNSSSPAQIQMLQIDCVVSSTNSINLPDTLVSLFNKSGQN